MFPSYLPVKAPDPGAYHFNFLGHNQKCLTYKKSIPFPEYPHVLSIWNFIITIISLNSRCVFELRSLSVPGIISQLNSSVACGSDSLRFEMGFLTKLTLRL